MEVIWHDPPPPGKYGDYLIAFRDALKDNPGEWGELPSMNGEHFPITVATTLKDLSPFIDATTRPTGVKNRYRIWGRWLDEPAPRRQSQGRKERVDALQNERRQGR